MSSGGEGRPELRSPVAQLAGHRPTEQDRVAAGRAARHQAHPCVARSCSPSFPRSPQPFERPDVAAKPSTLWAVLLEWDSQGLSGIASHSWACLPLSCALGGEPREAASPGLSDALNANVTSRHGARILVVSRQPTKPRRTQRRKVHGMNHPGHRGNPQTHQGRPGVTPSSRTRKEGIEPNAGRLTSRPRPHPLDASGLP